MGVSDDFNFENRTLGAPQWSLGLGVCQTCESPIVMNTGRVPLPVKGEAYVGGHAVMAVGYDDQSRMVLIRNSWSAKWGIEGYRWISYDYLTSPDLAADF